MNYEQEQEYLLRLWEEVDSDPAIEHDDDEDFDKDDQLEEREGDSESEQDLEDEVNGEGVDDEILSKPKQRTEPYFTGKDRVTKWRKHLPSLNVRTRSKNIVTRLPGVKGPARNLRTIVDIWKCFFDEEILNMIVSNTNLFITQQEYDRQQYRTARPTDLIEIKALLGLLYLAAVRKTNHLNATNLWSSNGTSIEMFRLTMSLERFRFLLRHIRFDNKATRLQRQKTDKLATIRDLFELFIANCKSTYTPSQYTTIDEKLEAFRGRCSFRQYIPSKPNKYGIKIYALVDAKMFFTSNLEVYVGKQPDGPYAVENSAKAVVERLVAPIANTGRNVTTDNWFTSMELSESLLKNYKLTLLGTIRKNKPQLPREFVEEKTRPIGSSMFGFQENSTLVSYVPKKGRNVLLLSTIHNDDKIDANTGKPDMIMMYNSTKGGVDVVDKLCAGYNCARATRRWPMVIFYSLMNIAGINAFVIFNSNNPNSNMFRGTFLETLALDLIAEHLKRRTIIQ